jgi:pilus assembly protein CpaD
MKELETMARPIGLVMLGLLALSACAAPAAKEHAPDPLIPSEHFAIEVSPAPLELRLAPHAHGLSPAQTQALLDFVGRWRDADQGEITLRTPEHAADPAAAYRTVNAARDFLVQNGVDPNLAHIVGYEAGDASAPIVLSFTRYEARGPQCGQSWEDLAHTTSNREYDNFGCAITANLAAEVANPRDILAPRQMDPPDTMRRESAITKWRTPAVMSTPKDPQADVRLSSVVQ